MFNKLTEVVLPPIIGVMVHRTEQLSPKAQQAQDAFLSTLNITERKTKKPIVVGMLGLVGSGKSTVSQELAPLIGATVVDGDAIRIQLRKVSERYKYVRQIAENVALEVLKRGGNVILDTDQIDDKKRASTHEKVRKAGAELYFVRTSADPHVMLGRMLAASYKKSVDDLFGGAKTNWKDGNEQQTGAVIKFGEAWRRTPNHYRWVNEGGGRWELKKLPFALLADIDTTDPAKLKDEVNKVAQKLISS